MAKPSLHVFAISHYCEKARWALDYLGVDYDVAYEMPGRHAQTAQQLGVSGTSVPILVTADGAIQGSAEILDWAEGQPRAHPERTLEGGEAAREIERRLDDVVGVHVRRFFYSEALVEHSETVRPIFSKDLAPADQQALEGVWGLVRQAMIEKMDLGLAQGEESEKIVAGELDWLDGLLADGRRFLVGDAFSRADLTAAALLARTACAEQHPQHRFMALPPRLAETQRAWNDRPTLVWIRELYAKYR